MSIIKHVPLQKIVAHDFRYVARNIAEILLFYCDNAYANPPVLLFTYKPGEFWLGPPCSVSTAMTEPNISALLCPLRI